MIDSLMLASHGFFGGFSGGGIGNLLSYWEQAGFFSYVLPFLLIFALVFGILTRVQIFKDSKVINGIIALTVGLLALQFNFVPIFFSEIFPRLGVALAVILMILILLGLFLDPKKAWVGFLLFGIAAIIVIVVLVQTFGYLGYGGGFLYFIYDYWPTIVGIILFLVVIGVIIGAGKTPPRTPVSYNPILFGGNPGPA